RRSSSSWQCVGAWARLPCRNHGCILSEVRALRDTSKYRAPFIQSDRQFSGSKDSRGPRPAGAGVGSRPTKARRTSLGSNRLELPAAASPASTGSPAPGRALGASRFQEAHFVAVASDSCWQFGLACQTSWCDRHAVRLSKLWDVAEVSAGVAPCRQTVAPL